MNRYGETQVIVLCKWCGKRAVLHKTKKVMRRAYCSNECAMNAVKLMRRANNGHRMTAKRSDNI